MASTEDLPIDMDEENSVEISVDATFKKPVLYAFTLQNESVTSSYSQESAHPGSQNQTISNNTSLTDDSTAIRSRPLKTTNEDVSWSANSSIVANIRRRPERANWFVNPHDNTLRADLSRACISANESFVLEKKRPHSVLKEKNHCEIDFNVIESPASIIEEHKVGYLRKSCKQNEKLHDIEFLRAFDSFNDSMQPKRPRCDRFDKYRDEIDCNFTNAYESTENSILVSNEPSADSISVSINSVSEEPSLLVQEDNDSVKETTSDSRISSMRAEVDETKQSTEEPCADSSASNPAASATYTIERDASLLMPDGCEKCDRPSIRVGKVEVTSPMVSENVVHEQSRENDGVTQTDALAVNQINSFASIDNSCSKMCATIEISELTDMQNIEEFEITLSNTYVIPNSASASEDSPAKNVLGGNADQNEPKGVEEDSLPRETNATELGTVEEPQSQNESLPMDTAASECLTTHSHLCLTEYSDSVTSHPESDSRLEQVNGSPDAVRNAASHAMSSSPDFAPCVPLDAKSSDRTDMISPCVPPNSLTCMSPPVTKITIVSPVMQEPSNDAVSDPLTKSVLPVRRLSRLSNHAAQLQVAETSASALMTETPVLMTGVADTLSTPKAKKSLTFQSPTGSRSVSANSVLEEPSLSVQEDDDSMQETDGDHRISSMRAEIDETKHSIEEQRSQNQSLPMDTAVSECLATQSHSCLSEYSDPVTSHPESDSHLQQVNESPDVARDTAGHEMSSSPDFVPCILLDAKSSDRTDAISPSVPPSSLTCVSPVVPKAAIVSPVMPEPSNDAVSDSFTKSVLPVRRSSRLSNRTARLQVAETGASALMTETPVSVTSLADKPPAQKAKKSLTYQSPTGSRSLVPSERSNADTDASIPRKSTRRSKNSAPKSSEVALAEPTRRSTRSLNESTNISLFEQTIIVSPPTAFADSSKGSSRRPHFTVRKFRPQRARESVEMVANDSLTLSRASSRSEAGNSTSRQSGNSVTSSRKLATSSEASTSASRRLRHSLLSDELNRSDDDVFVHPSTINRTRTAHYSTVQHSAATARSKTFNDTEANSLIGKLFQREASLSTATQPSHPPRKSKQRKRSGQLMKYDDDKDNAAEQLPKKPNFPKFDRYIGDRFYGYLKAKMEPKYGLATNKQAVALAKFISETVSEVSHMKTDYHEKVRELKFTLARKQVIRTHHDFYVYCEQYLPLYFNWKAVPALQPFGLPLLAEFDPDTILVPILSDSDE